MGIKIIINELILYGCIEWEIVTALIVTVVVNAAGAIHLMIKVVTGEMRRVHDIHRSRCPHDIVANKTRVGRIARHIDENPANPNNFKNDSYKIICR